MEQQTSEVSNNIDESELDEETLQKLKGDCIGDTVYSQKFVLKTLIHYSNLEWSEDLEQDLCSLWDMTVDEEVSKFLLNLSYSSLCCAAITSYKDNSRFVEIAVGMLANILSVCKNEKIKEEEVNIILSFLESEDPYILIQVVRFMIGIGHNHASVEFVSEDVMAKLHFILNNSLNEELLQKTFYFIVSSTADYKLDKKMISSDLFICCLKGYENLIQLQNGDENEREFDTTEKQQTMRSFMESLINICCYVEKYEIESLHEAIKSKSNDVIKELTIISTFFSQEETLFPITDEIDSFLTNIPYLLQCLDAPLNEQLFESLFKIILILSESNLSQEEYFKNVIESVCFFLHKSDERTISKTLQHRFSSKKVRTALNLIRDYGAEYSFSYKNVLFELLNRIK